MASPFPGMDPYLEAHWGDVHHRLINYACDAIQEALPPELRARMEERVVLEEPADNGTTFFPDVRVVEYPPAERHGFRVPVTGVAVTEPLLVKEKWEPSTEGYIEIIDVKSGNRVVTVIEVLSPSNKMPGEGMVQYCRKQREIRNSATSLVEIDLLLSGRHVLAVPLSLLSAKRRTPYMVCVRRAWVRDTAEVYPILLSQKLPTLKIPLRQGDADVPLDLQALIEESYRKGRYDGDLDYRVDPDPPLIGAEAEWADELLRSKGLRPTRSPKGKGKRKPPRPS